MHGMARRDTSLAVDFPADGQGSPDPLLVAQEHWRARGWPAGPRFLAALSVLRVEEIIRRSNTAALEPHGLTHTRHEALALLYFSRNGEMPLVKLSERLMLHPTSITSTVDALERLGLVDRVPLIRPIGARRWRGSPRRDAARWSIRPAHSP